MAKKQSPKLAKTTTIRRLPPEWHEFKKIASDEGLSGTGKLKKFIIETVKKTVKGAKS